MTNRRRVAWAVVILAIAAVLLLRRAERPAKPPAPPAAGHAAPTAAGRDPRIAALIREIPRDQISPIANDLNAPGGTIRHDLDILNAVFEAWRSNFPKEGNPVGENDEITRALVGDNPVHFAFIAPDHPAINSRGELCDRWGTPFRFHQLSGTEMEIRSAGPDRKFGTKDDAEFAPWPKPF
ncbi:MAG TPA: hypothetical protein VHE61_12705 [Opitutaceae bacterium]|nr:hypothetical protein [Opitutaceae bacterium]